MRKETDFGAAVSNSNEDPLVGAARIATALGIDERTLRKWRAENRYDLARIVKQDAPGRPVSASRAEVKAAGNARFVANNPSAAPDMAAGPGRQFEPRPFTGTRAKVLAAIEEATSPLTAAEIAEIIGIDRTVELTHPHGASATSLIYPELVRLCRAGALQRTKDDRIAGRGRRRVYRYFIGNPEIFAATVARAHRSRAAALRSAGR